jgi:hypothetical protein
MFSNLAYTFPLNVHSRYIMRQNGTYGYRKSLGAAIFLQTGFVMLENEGSGEDQ